MKYNQAFVRAQLPNGKWVNADILDLTQESFNAFILGKLCDAGVVVRIKDEAMGSIPNIPMKVKKSKTYLYENN